MMIDYLLYIPTCFAVNLAFGPNNLLAITHAVEKGVPFAVSASIGRIIAFALMIALSALGLGIILSTSLFLFTLLKIIGAAYLIWIGWKILRTANMAPSDIPTHSQTTLFQGIKREALIAIGNPKAILVFAAFIPQFVDTNHYIQSYVILGAIFLALEVVAIAVYASIGSFTARSAKLKLQGLQRASGIGMMIFGALLLFAKRPA